MSSPPLVDGLTAEEQAMFSSLCKLHEEKVRGNELRLKYYDGDVPVKHLGITAPSKLKNKIDARVGWPAKAVDVLASRSVFEGFVSNGDEDTLKRLNDSLIANDFDLLYAQGTTDELIHSCSFLTVTKGLEGEPGSIISCYSALDAAAEWDMRHHRIKYGMAIVDRDDKGEPCWYHLYTDTGIIQLQLSKGTWTMTRFAHALGRPLMVPLVYRPSLRRPFGRSRITRAVMSITDEAQRTVFNTEVASEFFTAPQKFLLGADPSQLGGMSKWDAYIGYIFAISKDKDNMVPTFGQLPQMSFQPLVEKLRSLASRFASETNTPVSYLGVIHDNPSSAEAIYASEEDLIIEAQRLNRFNGAALKTIGEMVLAALLDKPLDCQEITSLQIEPRFRNPAMPSMLSQSDAIVKQAAVIPWIGQTEVALEELGYTSEQIRRMEHDRRYADGQSLIRLLAEVEDDQISAQRLPERAGQGM